MRAEKRAAIVAQLPSRNRDARLLSGSYADVSRISPQRSGMSAGWKGVYIALSAKWWPIRGMQKLLDLGQLLLSGFCYSLLAGVRRAAAASRSNTAPVTSADTGSERT